MPMTIDIIEDGRVVRLIVTDPWFGYEMPPLFKIDQAHRDQFHTAQPHKKIHLLVDMQAKTLPLGVFQGRHTPSLSHPTAGQLVLVGANSLLQSMAEAAMRIAHLSSIKFFSTVGDALVHLRQVILEEDGRLESGEHNHSSA
jgi:hypothetical protein